MIFKKLTAAKGEGRKQLVLLDNLLGSIFMIIVLCFSLIHGYLIFATFGMGLMVARIGEIIFEIKLGFFDRPFFHCLLIIGIPLQVMWNIFVTK